MGSRVRARLQTLFLYFPTFFLAIIMLIMIENTIINNPKLRIKQFKRFYALKVDFWWVTSNLFDL